MKVLIYEWVSGGGLLGEDGPLPASLLREGTAMARSVGEDFARLPGAEVALLRDIRVMGLNAKGCKLIGVDSPSERDEVLDQQMRSADAVLLIAPETDGHLLRLCREAESLGARLISPGSEFIAIAANKMDTAQRLAAAGVRVPDGVLVDEGEPLPTDHPYPAVIKPIDGAGSEDTYLMYDSSETPPPYAWARRLEPFINGMAASVAVLLGEAGPKPLMPCRQRLSADGRFRYLGGSAPLAPGLVKRAQQLSLDAVRAMPPASGYVGLDLVLGADPTGTEDYVIEINPRLTTSYAGLRFAARTSLAEAMVHAARGESTNLAFDERPILFDPDGIVSYLDE
ncbi:carbamoyl phosphate synthase-like protein [Posidoniimonas polymericola]|uniref:Carbamoyl phosphate synthase-like protein n=1 Tax=Posidoniimonas polymericola TaxID=2528002 RepID=A0A5C5YLV6_9BACT|nr:ATP-grasp domain-containing protein [Posidoniimonas polymericola]TWT75820.1 carbamoyl phosphate synthase-like protein [Posidoniimonas polymericola]